MPLALFLLFLTYSRAAWLGIAAGGAVWVLLRLAQNGLLSKSGFLNMVGKADPHLTYSHTSIHSSDTDSRCGRGIHFHSLLLAGRPHR